MSRKNDDIELLMAYSAEIGKPPEMFGSQETIELARRRRFAAKYGYETSDVVGECWKGE